MIDPRDDPHFLRSIVDDLRAGLFDAEAAMVLAVVCLKVYSSLRRERPHCAMSERLVLGALFAGSASLADVAELRADDFHVDGHGTLFAVFVSVIEASGCSGKPLGRVQCSVVRRALQPGQLPHADAALAAAVELPAVYECPREAIAIVRAFADWSANA